MSRSGPTGPSFEPLKITGTLCVPQTARPVVLDGMGLVTLDGGLEHRIIMKGWRTDLTVQRMRFVNARAEKSGGAIPDRKRLALALLRDGEPGDHASAAFYLTAGGDRRGAREHLARSGEAAKEVAASFTDTEALPRGGSER